MNNDELKRVAIAVIKQFAKKELLEGFKPINIHPYYNEAGKLLYFRCRLKHADGRKWIRPFHFNPTQNNWIMGEPKFSSEKPLYGLLGLNSSDPQSDVWVVEGEQKVDALIKLGVVAITSGSSSSASSVDWKPLSKRNIVIWPDFDDSGDKYMQEVSIILQPLKCSIRCIDVAKLKLPNKGDVIDWLNLNPEAN